MTSLTYKIFQTDHKLTVMLESKVHSRALNNIKKKVDEIRSGEIPFFQEASTELDFNRYKKTLTITFNSTNATYIKEIGENIIRELQKLLPKGHTLSPIETQTSRLGAL